MGGQRPAGKLQRLLGRELDRRVFWGAAGLSLPFIVLGGLSPGALGAAADRALAFLTGSFSWLYLVSCSLFVLVCLVLALSPLGRVRLGRDDEKPEFSFFSWTAMLFSAGMGIGLVFWGAAEPMLHYLTPPTGEGRTAAAARLGFEIFYFHWGLHAWATYVVVGLPMAFFTFRRGRPATVSACLEGLLGPRFAASPGGSLVDVLAIWATILGVVTSLGMGALQIQSGLAHATPLTASPHLATAIIVVITTLFVISAATGINRGIKVLSQFNVFLMVAVMIFFYACGPFRHLVATLGQALADYVTDLVPLSTSLVLFDNPGWTKGWTVFYWAWWVAWAPFVGAFIARISRGRTVREFILVVLLVPPIFSYLFATALGGTAVWLDLVRQLPIGAAVQQSIEVALFETLRHLPLYGLLVVVTNILIASFFITSADSATFVIAKFSSAGREPSDPAAWLRLIVFWGAVLGALAVVLIYSGGLKALQTASIAGAFPFLFVMYLLLASLIKALIREPRV